MEFSSDPATVVITPTTIADLLDRQRDFEIEALVIAKSSVRAIAAVGKGPQTSILQNQGSNQLFVFNFTIRDSVSDFINAAYWGSTLESVKAVSDQFCIGDVVLVARGRVVLKTDNNFVPPSTSCFQITLNEQVTSIRRLCSAKDHEMYRQLISTPIRDATDYLTLLQLTRHAPRLIDRQDDGAAKNTPKEYVNVLVAVKSLNERHFKTKDGRDSVRMEMRVMDHSCRSFSIETWDSEMIHFAKTFWDRNEVVFFSDLRVKRDDFRNTYLAATTALTVAIPHPSTPDAENLRRLIQTETSELYGGQNEVNEEASTSASSTERCTIEQLKKQLLEKNRAALRQQQEQLFSGAVGFQFRSGPGDSFEGIVYACITKIDLDDPAKFIKPACGKCFRFFNGDDSSNAGMQCFNEKCRANLNNVEAHLVPQYCLSAELTDSTGTFYAYLSNKAASKLLGADPAQLQSIAPRDCAKLKWRMLFIKQKVFFKAVPASHVSGKSSIRVIDVERALLSEIFDMA